MQTNSRPMVLVIEASGKAALPVMESMARAGLRVAAASSTRVNAGFLSRYCHERHVYPSCRDRSDEFKAWLLSFLRRKGVSQLFPVGHYGTVAVSEIQDEVRRYSRLVLPPHNLFMKGYAKIPTIEAAQRAGVPVPISWFPQHLKGGLDEALTQINDWPVLIKPSIGVGANGIIWCHSAEEVKSRWTSHVERYGPCFIQDFVPPGGMQFKVDMLVDKHQRMLAGVVYGKSRMYPPDGGSSVLNVTVRRDDILELAHQVLFQLGWVGFCDFDFIEDPRDGVVRLMEINPRFPESFRICSAAGIDFPRMILDLGHGVSVQPERDYQIDQYLRFLPGDLLWFLRVDNQRRLCTRPSWFRFLDSSTTFQICSLRDPGAIVGYLLENAFLMLFDSKTRKARLRLHNDHLMPL